MITLLFALMLAQTPCVDIPVDQLQTNPTTIYAMFGAGTTTPIARLTIRLTDGTDTQIDIPTYAWTPWNGTECLYARVELPPAPGVLWATIAQNVNGVWSDQSAPSNMFTFSDVPPPQPIDCQGSWSPWLRGECTACVDGQQTCVESRDFTITQQPTTGGIACPLSPETRSVVVSCTTVVTCRNLATGAQNPQGTLYLRTFRGGEGPARQEITAWQNEGWSLLSSRRSGSWWEFTFQCR